MKIEIAALSATAHAAMTQGSVFGFGQGTFKFDTSGAFQKGHSTHYGPFPSLPEMNEVGYLKNDVGVGCSNGQPGGDPRWLEILKEGVMVNPLDPTTVWPNKPTVAVSQAAWSKQAVCFKTMTIRNAKIPAYSIEAVIVDFCPSQGCLWDKRMRHLNADIYGEATWKKLGANLTDGVIEIEIKWPEGIRPYSSKGIRSRSLESLIYFALITWPNLKSFTILMTDAECDELYMTLHCIILETAIEQEWRAVVHEPSQYTRVSSTTDVNYTNGKIFRHIKRLFPIVNHLTPQETWLIGAIATKFDALAFSKFYATIVAGILLEEWSPSGLDAGLYKRNCRVRERLKGSFSLSRSQDGTASVTFMDLERVQKICGLREAGRTLFRKLKCLQDIKISKKQEITRYWHHAFSAASTFDELLDEDKEAFNALFHVIAHVVFSVFDNPTTLERAKSLLRKVPISFITTSLYFMNPSRFLGQALRLYMWAPAEGIASLCQRLAGALCGYIQTRADYHRLLIQSKNEEWFEPVHQCFHNSNMSSMDPDHKYAEMLQNNNVDYSKKVLTFCRLHYRFHEKKLFVEHFTGVGDTSFIDFLGETLPEILNELQKAGSLSTLVSNFFGLLSNILTEVEKNSIVNKESIEKVVTLITEFMRYFYQYLHYAETKRDTAEGMPLFSSVIDIIFGTVLRLDDVETFHSCLGDFTYHQKVKNFVRSLNKNDSDSLWEFLRKARLEAENARLGTVAHQQIDYLVSLLVDTICID